MVLLHCDTNAILAEPLKDKTQTELVRDFTKLHKYLTTKGFVITQHVLDNEAPTLLLDYLTEQRI